MPSNITAALRDVDDLLRGDLTRPQSLGDRGLDVNTRRLAVVIIALCMIYGLCMGTFSLLKETPPALKNDAGRYLQIVASMVKTPALFFLTLVVTLPSLYVFNALVGSRLRLVSLVKLLVASLAVNAAVLASLGPIVAFFSVSTSSHAFIVLLNVAAFAVAGILGLAFLLQTLHRLSGAFPPPRHAEVVAAEAAVDPADLRPDAEGGPPEHLEPSALDMPQGDVMADHTRTVFRFWVVLFALVGAQMGWVLRPFIGAPDLPFTWFRERQSNFFGAVLRSLGELLVGPGRTRLNALLATADGVLRRHEWTTRSTELRSELPRLLGCLVAFALAYGALMGTFRGLTGQDQWLLQIAYSAVKVPLLLGASFAIGLPSFFVLSTLFGLRRDFGESVRALVAAQAGLAVVLASLGPITLLWYASSTDYQLALLFNGLIFAVASLAAQHLLRQYYRPLIQRDVRHRRMLACWGFIYVLVAIQLAWLLRPFIGAAGQPVQFLRPEAWDNAYVIVGRMIWNALGL